MRYRYGIKITIVVAAYYYLFRQLSTDWDKLLTSLHSFDKKSLFQSLVFLVFILTFAFINWAIEAIKWKILLNSFTQIRFKRALSQVLAGLASGVFTPNRLGEIPGRALFMSVEKRKKTIFLAGVNSSIQMIVTLLSGILAFFFYSKKLPLTKHNFSIFLFVLIFILLLPFLFRRFRNFFQKQIIKVKAYFLGLNSSLLIKIFVLSVFRYSIYLLQYFWAYRLSGIELNFLLLAQITAILLFVLHILPLLNAIDIGVRASVAILLFKSYGIAALPVFLAGFIIWSVNIFVPAFIGGLILLRETFQIK